MKRDENIYNYGHAVRQKEIAEMQVFPDDSVLPKETYQNHDPNEVFLKIVYAIDERTKLPTGDLQYLVNDKANPEVKQWVLQNIMIDTSAAVMPAAPRGMSDDDIASLARQPNESSSDYLNRVNDFAKRNADLYVRLDAAIRERNELDKQDVSSQSE